jgi:hypothetical protein
MSRVLVALAALIVALTASGGAAAATPCWEKVINDWTGDKHIDKTYRAACYDKAIAKLPTDLRYYSDAPETIQAAKEDMLRAQQARRLQVHEPGAEGSSSSNDPGTQSATSDETKKSDGDSPLGAALNWGPSAAGDVPVPLLIIAFLALLLMGAGAAGLINRRLHERRAGGPPEGPGPA